MKSTYEIAQAMQEGIITPLQGWRAMKLIVGEMSVSEKQADIESTEWCLWVAQNTNH